MAPFNQPLLPLPPDALLDMETTRLSRAIARVRSCEAKLAQAVTELRTVLTEIGIDTPHPIR